MSKPDLQQIKKMYAEALTLQKAGDDQSAANIYGEIIKINANIAEVHFQMARLFLKHDKLREALRHINAATKLKPGEKDVWHVRHEVTKALSDREITNAFVEEIEAAPLEKRVKSDLKTAVAFKRKPVATLITLPAAQAAGVAQLIESAHYKKAESMARVLIGAHPGEAVLYDLLGAALASQDRLADAEQAFLKAIKTNPEFSQARANYARLLNTLDRPEETLKQCNLALRSTPGYVDALFLRGLAFEKIKQSELAIEDHKRVLELDRTHHRARMALGSLLIKERAFLEARRVLEPALKTSGKDPLLHLSLGAAEVELNRTEKALEYFRSAIQLDPTLPRPYARVGEVLQSLGDFDASEESFVRSIELDPNIGQTYRVYLTGKKITPEDPIFAEMDKRFRDSSLPAVSRAHFGFALAKVMEDNKIYDRVFSYLHPANALMREDGPVEPETRKRAVSMLLDSMSTVDWKSAPKNVDCDFAPIFVTGMPRSGTTLVEQIVSSHSTVTSAGEIGEAGRLIVKTLETWDRKMRPASELRMDEYQKLAKDYEHFVRVLYPGSGRITDKSIQTSSYIGPLKLAMPKSRFVVVRRDPRDNLLSMYKNVFPEGTHLYAYNLTDLAEYQKMFVETLDFWRERVPDWFYEIQYEDLVANPEEEARKLIAACGLEWEDACLSFHESKQRVRTLSVYQVRQPIYKSSAKSWERYADDLKELFDALGPEYTDAAE